MNWKMWMVLGLLSACDDKSEDTSESSDSGTAEADADTDTDTDTDADADADADEAAQPDTGAKASTGCGCTTSASPRAAFPWLLLIAGIPFRRRSYQRRWSTVSPRKRGLGSG